MNQLLQPGFGHGALRWRRTHLRCKRQLSRVPPGACATTGAGPPAIHMVVNDRPSAREGAACGGPSDLRAIAPSQARGDLDDSHKSSASQRPVGRLLARTDVHGAPESGRLDCRALHFRVYSASQTGPAGSRDCACAWTRSPRSRHLTRTRTASADQARGHFGSAKPLGFASRLAPVRARPPSRIGPLPSAPTSCSAETRSAGSIPAGSYETAPHTYVQPKINDGCQ